MSDQRNKVIIFGAGQIAEVIHFYLKHDSPYEVCAFTVDSQYMKETSCRDLPVIPFEDVAREYPPQEYQIFVAVSFRKVNQLRAEKLLECKRKGYTPVSYISSKATTWPGLSLGENSFVMENNVIQPYASIGSNTIIWSGNHIGHHSRIGDNCFIASHAVISGAVCVGDYSFIGVNATIRDNVKIGKSCVIGAGALILEDTKDFEVYVGARTTPSRVPSNRIRNI